MLDPDTKITDKELQDILVVPSAEGMSVEQTVASFADIQEPSIKSYIKKITPLESNRLIVNHISQPIIKFDKKIEELPLELNQIDIDDSMVIHSNSESTISSNYTTQETHQMICETNNQKNLSSSLSPIIQSPTIETIFSLSTSVFNEPSSSSSNEPVQILKRSSTISSVPLQDVTNNKETTDVFESAINYQDPLPYPKVDLTARKRKRANSDTKIPSVLTSPQWQKIAQEKEDFET